MQNYQVGKEWKYVAYEWNKVNFDAIILESTIL